MVIELVALFSSSVASNSFAFCLSWKITNTAPKTTAIELTALRP